MMGVEQYQQLTPREENKDVITTDNTQSVVVPTLPASMGLLVGPTNTEVVCPYCQSTIKTTVKYTTTTRTHLVSLLTCLICCCCACFPFCKKGTRNSDHYCPSCNRFLGTYKK